MNVARLQKHIRSLEENLELGEGRGLWSPVGTGEGGNHEMNIEMPKKGEIAPGPSPLNSQEEKVPAKVCKLATYASTYDR